MIITENPFGAGNNAIKVSSRFMKIHVVATCTGMSATAAQAAIKAASLEIEKVTPSGTSDCVKITSLLDLLEAGTNLSHGAVRVITGGGNTVIKGTVNVGYDGDIEAQPNEWYTVRIKDVPADVSIMLFTLETKKNATMQFDYQKAKALQSVATPIEIAGTHLLALPKANLQKLELTGADGAKLTLLPDELEQHLSEMNPSSFNINGSITPVGLNYYVFPVASSVKAHVTYSADTTVMLINVIPL